MLLVCRRWPTGTRKPATQVVNLTINPTTPAEAISVAWAIENGSVESQDLGTVQSWPSSKIAAGDWGAVQFLSPYLCAKFAALNNNKLFPSLALENIADIGPAGQYVRGTFDNQAMPSSAGMFALWNHKTDLTQSMAANPDVHLVSKSGKQQQAQRLWNQRGRLLLPTRLFLPTARVTTARLNAPGLGSAWVPCKPNIPAVDTEHLEKSICVYLNSSVGILALLGDRSNRKPTYPNISIDDMHKLIVPDFGILSQASVEKLATAYDANANKTLLPLPLMDACPVRRALDTAVIDALGLDWEMIAIIRRSLASEPSVTGKRYTGQLAS